MSRKGGVPPPIASPMHPLPPEEDTGLHPADHNWVRWQVFLKMIQLAVAILATVVGYSFLVYWRVLADSKDAARAEIQKQFSLQKTKE